MIKNFGYQLLWGKPLIFYLGIVTLSMFLVTATIGYLIHSGRARINFKWHKTMAGLSLTSAFIHALMAILPYF